MDWSEEEFHSRMRRIWAGSEISATTSSFEPYVPSQSPLDSPGHSPFLTSSEPASPTSRSPRIQPYMRNSVQDGPPVPVCSSVPSAASAEGNISPPKSPVVYPRSKLLLTSQPPTSPLPSPKLQQVSLSPSPSPTTTPPYSPPNSPFLPPPHPLASFNEYAYISLPSWTPNAVRLVRLHPIPPNPQTQLEALPHLTTELHWLDLHPPYCALSYSWGQPEDLSEIFPASYDQFLADLRHEYEERNFVVIIDGMVLPIRKNLLEFLVTMGRQLACPDFVGYDLFWIDAVCINQADLVERNAQVSMMGRIYREAGRVLVWLGEDTRNEMDSVKRMLYKLLGMGMRVTRESSKVELSQIEYWDSVDQAQYLADAGLPMLRDHAWWPFCVFWRRSWFQRLWVLQEVAIARQIVMLCGQTTFEIQDLETAGFILRWGIDMELGSNMMRHRDRFMFRAVGRVIERIGNILRWCQIDEAPFLDSGGWIRLALNGTVDTRGVGTVWNLMLGMCVSAKSTMKIDRVFAVLGMVAHLTSANRRRPIVEVDYAKTEIEVRMQIISYILLETQWLNLIGNVQHTGGIVGSPSWLPDLTADGHTFITHSDYNTTMSLLNDRMAENLPFFTIDDNALHIPAFRLDTIVEVSGILGELLDEPPEVLAGMITFQDGIYTHTNETGTQALWNTLVGGTITVGKDKWLKSFLDFWLHKYCWEAVSIGREAAGEHSCDASLKQWLTEQLQDRFPKVERLALAENDPYLSYENIIEHAMRCNIVQQDAGEEKGQVRNAYLNDLYRAGELFRRESGKFVTRHQLFRTKKGFIGLAPDLTQIGDEVWLIPRTTVPFILRRYNGDEPRLSSAEDSLKRSHVVETPRGAQYQLIGESYTHGVMRGELFRDVGANDKQKIHWENIQLI